MFPEVLALRTQFPLHMTANFIKQVHKKGLNDGYSNR